MPHDTPGDADTLLADYGASLYVTRFGDTVTAVFASARGFGHVTATGPTLETAIAAAVELAVAKWSKGAA